MASISGNSGRITILVIGVTALSMLVSVVSLYLFMAAGRTMLPGPLAFRIAVSLPPTVLPAPPLPLAVAFQEGSQASQIVPAAETVAGAGQQIVDLTTQTLDLGTALGDLDQTPVLALAPPPEPVPVTPAPETPILAGDDSLFEDGSDDEPGNSGRAPGSDSGSGSSSGKGSDDDDKPDKSGKSDKSDKSGKSGKDK